MKKKFLEKYQVNEKLSAEKIRKIYGENFNPLLADLLYVRGINNTKSAEEFCNPK